MHFNENVYHLQPELITKGSSNSKWEGAYEVRDLQMEPEWEQGQQKETLTSSEGSSPAERNPPHPFSFYKEGESLSRFIQSHRGRGWQNGDPSISLVSPSPIFLPLHDSYLSFSIFQLGRAV